MKFDLHVHSKLSYDCNMPTDELIEFTAKLSEKYKKVLGSEVFTLHKLKEVWIYAIRNFPEETKTAKAIKKAGDLSDFMAALRCLPKL